MLTIPTISSESDYWTVKIKKGFVNSKSGEARHTFTVNTSGEYRLFIEGLENKNIHITGSIYIKLKSWKLV